MKNYMIAAAAAMSFGLVACEEPAEPNVEPVEVVEPGTGGPCGDGTVLEENEQCP